MWHQKSDPFLSDHSLCSGGYLRIGTINPKLIYTKANTKNNEWMKESREIEVCISWFDVVPGTVVCLVFSVLRADGKEFGPLFLDLKQPLTQLVLSFSSSTQQQTCLIYLGYPRGRRLPKDCWSSIPRIHSDKHIHFQLVATIVEKEGPASAMLSPPTRAAGILVGPAFQIETYLCYQQRMKEAKACAEKVINSATGNNITLSSGPPSVSHLLPCSLSDEGLPPQQLQQLLSVLTDKYSELPVLKTEIKQVCIERDGLLRYLSEERRKSNEKEIQEKARRICLLAKMENHYYDEIEALNTEAAQLKERNITLEQMLQVYKNGSSDPYLEQENSVLKERVPKLVEELEYFRQKSQEIAKLNSFEEPCPSLDWDEILIFFEAKLRASHKRNLLLEKKNTRLKSQLNSNLRLVEEMRMNAPTPPNRSASSERQTQKETISPFEKVRKMMEKKAEEDRRKKGYGPYKDSHRRSQTSCTQYPLETVSQLPYDEDAKDDDYATITLHENAPNIEARILYPPDPDEALTLLAMVESRYGKVMIDTPNGPVPLEPPTYNFFPIATSPRKGGDTYREIVDLGYTILLHAHSNLAQIQARVDKAFVQRQQILTFGFLPFPASDHFNSSHSNSSPPGIQPGQKSRLLTLTHKWLSDVFLPFLKKNYYCFKRTTLDDELEHAQADECVFQLFKEIFY